MTPTTRIAVIAQYKALASLASDARVLPSVSADLRVARLLRALRPTVEDYDRARAGVYRRFEGRELSIEEKVTMSAELLELDLQAIEVAYPSLQLTIKDLPVALARDGGESNRAGLANIIAQLGDLYLDVE